MNKTLIMVIAVLSMLLLPTSTALAFHTDYVLVDMHTEFVDLDAEVYNTYIVWQRADNVDDAGAIVSTDPSWIMLNRHSKDETYSLTPENTPGQHYVKPKIWNNKVITGKYISSNNYQLHMFNVSRNESWLPLETISAAILPIYDIYGDWIVFATYNSGNHRLYMYNYEDPELRYISMDDGYTMSYVTLDDEFVVYRKTTGGISSVNIYNITSERTVILTASDIGATNIRADSIDDGKIPIWIEETVPQASYNIYLYDTKESSDWINITSPTQSYDWSTHVYDNATQVMTNYSIDVDGQVKINSRYVVYTSYEGKVAVHGGSADDSCNVYAYNYIRNSTEQITDNAYFQHFQDVFGDKIVWRDNRNSDTHVGDHTDVFNLMRTTTSSEHTTEVIFNMLPLIIVMAVVPIVAGLGKAFSGGGL